jgi:hypothetical protein
MQPETVLFSKKERIMEGMIFVRERRKVEQGEKKPRYRVLGVSGVDLKIYANHIRKKELDQLAKATKAKVVVLTAGKAEKKPA